MPRSSARLLYLCFEGLPKTVFDTQVLGFLKMMAAQGLVFDLFIFESPGSAIRNKSWNATRLEELKGTWGGEVYYFPFGTKYTFPLAATVFLLCLAKNSKPGHRLILHCRGNYSALLAALLKKISRQIFSVYDMRGDIVAEFQYRITDGTRPRSFRRRMETNLLWWAEGFAAREADHILCVSSVLKERLQQRWAMEGKAIDIVPTCADPQLFRFDDRIRQEVRRQMGLEDRFVLVYSGSMYRWQLIDRIIDLTRRLRETSPNVHLLCLTPHLAEAGSSLTSGLPEGCYTLIHAPHVEMPGYLMAADLAVLIREDHPLNEVACPTKFAEYVMCGLPVLITEGLGDLSELVQRKKLGILMKDEKDFTALDEPLATLRMKAASSSWRLRTAEVGRELFAWNHYAPLLREIYEKALSNCLPKSRDVVKA